jgi:hypothetical protein
MVGLLPIINGQALTFNTWPKSYPLSSEIQPCILVVIFFPLEISKGLLHSVYNPI